MQRDLQGQVQRKKVERRYSTEKGAIRVQRGTACLISHSALSVLSPIPPLVCVLPSIKERVQTGGAERVSVRGLRGGAQRDAER